MKEGESHMHNTPAASCVKKDPQALSPEEMLFFAARPEELELYEQFRAWLLSEVGELRVKVTKTQISFTGKHGFAFVSHPRRKKDRGIVVSFGLSHQQQSARIFCAAEPYPNRWTHHVLVQTADEIDGELMDWLQEAHWFADHKQEKQYDGSGSRPDLGRRKIFGLSAACT